MRGQSYGRIEKPDGVSVYCGRPAQFRTWAYREQRHSLRDPAEGKTAMLSIATYVYVMYFAGDRITHMQEIWHAALAMREPGGE